MCYRNEYHLRCGHRRGSPLLHCTSATRNPLTGRWNKCRRKTGKHKVPSDELCGDKDDCQLSAYDGRWICCKCRFGYKPGEVNRGYKCVAGRCSHDICWGCDARTEENIRAKYAEDESEDSAEIEKATNEDTSLDSIVFNDDIDDDDVAEEPAES
jgi:hypothetical protein